MTDEQYYAWLKAAESIRIVLVEAQVQTGGVETTRYLASGTYVTGAGEVPANQTYTGALIADDLVTNESLSLNDNPTMTIGEIGIRNPDGRFDDWLLDIWTNRPVRVYLGDPRWARDQFRLVFDGVVASLGSKGRDSLNLKLRDKLQRLNGAVTEAKLGGTTTNKDTLLPVTLGEVHNITPLLVDPAQLEYQFHNGAAERVIEVRDNGVPVSIVDMAASGKFRLTQAPAGAVTASVQGVKPSGTYTNTISKLVQHLVTAYGKAEDRFVAADLDATNLAAFDTAHPQPVGLHLSDRINVIVACQELTKSVGAQMTISRLGKLQLYQLDFSSLAPTFDIHPRHMAQHSLAIASRLDVSAAVKLGFCKNWTDQPGLQTSLSAGDKELFDTEWLTATAIDESARALHRLTAEPEQEDTHLLRRTDAEAEALRRVAIRKVARTVFQFEGFAELLRLELGQHVRLHHPRFNLEAGVAGIVVSLSTKWARGRVTVGVMI